MRGIPRSTSRSLFGFSRKVPKEPRATDLDPGFLQLLELNNMLAIKARPPSVESIIKAFRELFTSKQKEESSLEELQAHHAIIAVRYLRKENHEEAGFGLSTKDLQTAMYVLSRRKRNDEHQEKVVELAKIVFEELQSRRAKDPSAVQEYGSSALNHYVQILTRCGESMEARRLVVEFQSSEPLDNEKPRFLWKHLLAGFAAERNDEEILQTIELMGQNGLPFDATFHQQLVQSCIHQDNLAMMKRWYLYPIDQGAAPRPRISCKVLRTCVFHKHFDWAQSIATKMMEKNPEKAEWDVLFQLAAGKGKGVEEVERMMTVMVQRTEKGPDRLRPDTSTINDLISLANKMNDPYLAERYVGLAERWKIPLNAFTYLMQMDYRIKAGDITGARHAYARLQGHEFSNKDIPLVNKLILVMCNANEPDHEAIMGLVEDMTERNFRFEPDTVSALCLLHLKRNELHDVIDLLQTHVFHYELQERASIRDMFVGFCLDRSNNTATAWDAYTILRQLFDETDREIRTKLMDEFFDRRRSDMAIHVFGHMRQSPFQERRPTADTYTQCFEGIAKQADLNALETVHNMLKLDSEVEPDTRLHNALMLAYTACGQPERSLEFWDDVVYSREGPTYNSICIALQACEAMPFGERQARDIWKRLKKFDIDVTKEIYVGYVAALARHGLIAESMEQLGKMEAEVGHRPDSVSLGIFYNASPGVTKKAEVETWIKDKYPGAWKDLEKIGKTKPRGGNGVFMINRRIPA
ncbi:hypothetical protein MMC30_006492 [Trapelia coarctata]|nr:hypothetical protein [Trapelia coarctata]